jgi:hypothetical protein
VTTSGEGVMTRRPRRYTGTSSPHRQCRRVIDGKIPGRIVVPGDEPESRDYSARRSSDPSVTLVYWGGLSPPSLLDAKSYIYLRGKSRAQEDDQNASSSIDQSQTSNDCDRTTIHPTSVYVTQAKSREGKSYSVQPHSTSPSCAPLFHPIFLCTINGNH